MLVPVDCATPTKLQNNLRMCFEQITKYNFSVYERIGGQISFGRNLKQFNTAAPETGLLPYRYYQVRPRCSFCPTQLQDESGDSSLVILPMKSG